MPAAHSADKIRRNSSNDDPSCGPRCECPPIHADDAVAPTAQSNGVLNATSPPCTTKRPNSTSKPKGDGTQSSKFKQNAPRKEPVANGIAAASAHQKLTFSRGNSGAASSTESNTNPTRRRRYRTRPRPRTPSAIRSIEKFKSNPTVNSPVALASSNVPRPTEQPTSIQVPVGGALNNSIPARTNCK